MPTLARLDGTGTGGIFTPPEPWMATAHAQRLREIIDVHNRYLLYNVLAGGSVQLAMPAEATGDVRLYEAFPPVELDDTLNQLTDFSDANGATLVARFRYALRVNNAAINITPKIKHGATISTITTVASITGQAACSATSDAYTGANQIQTILFALPADVKSFLPYITIAGTPAAGYLAWARALLDVFVQLP